jgi:hypothetical protein
LKIGVGWIMVLTQQEAASSLLGKIFASVDRRNACVNIANRMFCDEYKKTSNTYQRI